MPSTVCQAISGNALRLMSEAAATIAVMPGPQASTRRRVTSAANPMVATMISIMDRKLEPKNSGIGSAKSATCSTAEPSGRAEMISACGTSPCSTRHAWARMKPWSDGWKPKRPTRSSVASASSTTQAACTLQRSSGREGSTGAGSGEAVARTGLATSTPPAFRSRSHPGSDGSGRAARGYRPDHPPPPARECLGRF